MIAQKTTLPSYAEELIREATRYPKGQRGAVFAEQLIAITEALHYEADLLSEEDMDAIAVHLKNNFIDVHSLA